ncbi:Proton-coupled amino acid transporter 4 [Acromyrmex echinatior]|uniref:Proton-coupled amino acid transporter 4 n=1 Tax=Acromyrmex echinatior TaxID=103372 RepID=F4WW00_ACREC|nr:Proton-coupled amino acid transporter 4 [Acromyrmex echinatior]
MAANLAETTRGIDKDFAVYMHLLKCAIGTGILFLPHAFRRTGYAMSIVCGIVMGMLCMHVAVILVQCSQILCRRNRVPMLDLAETAQFSFQSGPERIRKYSRLFGVVTNVLIFFVHFQTAVIYILYVATSFQQVIEFFANLQLNSRVYIVIFFPFACALGFVPNLKYLAPFSIIGTFFLFLGVCTAFYYFLDDIPDPSRLDVLTEALPVPMYCAIFLFALHNMTLYLPLENTMRHPSHMPRIIITSTFLNIIIYLVFGFLGYNKYPDACDTVIKNLPMEETLAQVVKIAITLSVLFSFGLTYYVPIKVLWPIIYVKIATKSSLQIRIYNCLLRLGGVVITKKELSDNPMTEFSSSTKIAPNIGEYKEKDELYDPFEHRDKQHATSDLGSLAHLLKSSLGTGILAMPHAIKNGGLLFGGIGTIIIGFICAHCVHILVRTSHILCRRTKTPQMTYAETAYAAFLCGPKLLRPWANISKIFVNTALCATYVGGSCVYVVFVSRSLQQIVNFNTDKNLDIELFIYSLIPALVLLGQVRDLKYMVPFSALANIFMITGFSITLYYIFSSSNLQSFSNNKLFASVDQLPRFFATVIFAIEGIGVVMPVANNMKYPHHFLGCPSVLNITMTIVVSLYAMMGVFGFLAFGEDVQPSITLSLPTNEIPAQVVKALIALAVLFTYGLQLFVPLEIMWNSIKHLFNHKFLALGETVMRICIVMLTVVFALLVPDLDPFISLVGAIFFSILGISIPAVVETISCWESHLGTFNWRLWKNSVLVTFSLLALAFGSWISVQDIINLRSK